MRNEWFTTSERANLDREQHDFYEGAAADAARRADLERATGHALDIDDEEAF